MCWCLHAVIACLAETLVLLCKHNVCSSCACCPMAGTPCQHLQQFDMPSFCVLGLLMGGHLPIIASTATLSKAAGSVAMGFLPTTATQRCCLHHISCRCFHPSSLIPHLSASALSCPPHLQCLVHHISNVLSTTSVVCCPPYRTGTKSSRTLKH